jgi:UDP-N-acetylmuramoyl-L-alanyl-D-glutamate--2,6-diaminopimelate ligase
MSSAVKATRLDWRPKAPEKQEARRREAENNSQSPSASKGRDLAGVIIKSRSPMILKELLKAIPVQVIEGTDQCEVRGLTVDSRQVDTDFVFVAIDGQTTDGHLYLRDARKRGAVAVVSEKAPQHHDMTWVQTPDARRAAGLLSAAIAGQPARKLSLVGVTGTNGKTTIAYLVDALIRRFAPPSAMMGTVVHQVGDMARSARLTTPEAPEIQSFLSRAVEAGCRYGVLEISSHGIALGRVEGTEFNCAVFTNLSRDHLDFHRDMEDYFASKRVMFDRYLRQDGTAVVGLDDGFGRRLAESLPHGVSTFGFAPDADLRIEDMDASFDGLDISFRERGRLSRLRSPLIGRHNALNLLAAFGVGRALGFESEAILGILENAHGAPGRYEKVEAGQPFLVVVDYAHTDDALKNLLETTRALPHRKILTVFGCGGDRDSSKRPLMGAVAVRLSDYVVLTSDNPRSEDPMAIIGEIDLGTKGLQSNAEVMVEPDRRKAIALAISLAAPGDVVLITGKGHESYQTIRDQVLPFDDRQVVREILSGGGQN